LLKTFISRTFTHWELVIGLILIAVVLLFPAGISGLLEKLGVGRTADAQAEARS
jgi:ABC-type branched-subunit amino acid transport system permease subunit